MSASTAGTGQGGTAALAAWARRARAEQPPCRAKSSWITMSFSLRAALFRSQMQGSRRAPSQQETSLVDSSVPCTCGARSARKLDRMRRKWCRSSIGRRDWTLLRLRSAYRVQLTGVGCVLLGVPCRQSVSLADLAQRIPFRNGARVPGCSMSWNGWAQTKTCGVS
jgi:hypothetical protein